MRWVSTRVLPEPAPATISSGPSVWVTASRWTGFSPSRSGVVRQGLMATQPTVPPLDSYGSGRDRPPGRRRGAARQPQPAPARVPTAAPSSTRRTSTGWRPGRCGSPTTTPGSLPCMPARHDLLVGALDFPWRPWGSIEMWEDAITHLLRRDAGRLHDAGVRPPAPVRDRRRELPHRLRRLGLPARPRGRPVAHPAGPVVDRRAGAARRAGRPWERAYDVSRTWFTDEADFPGPARWPPPRAWLDGELCGRRGSRTSASCWSSTSSTRTSRSTRPSPGPAATTPTGRASGSSGRRTPATPGAGRADRARGRAPARRSTAPSSR